MNAHTNNPAHEHRILIAGFGGQGILSLGKLLCNAAISENANATYMPSYGTEVRGGTCNCHLVISLDEIFSPYVEKADFLIILNQMSFKRFNPILAPDGLLMYDSSMVDVPDDATIDTQTTVGLPARDLAAEMGNELVANVILLGGFIGTTELCEIDNLEEAVENWLTPNKVDQIEINLQALHKGVEMAAGGFSPGTSGS
ncbi:MAG: 2-oxoacid:acceptor oxidoreductase family protein [Planctomycetota bacterium]